MAAVTVIFPDTLLARVDAVVAQRKAAAAPYKKPTQYLTEAQRTESFKIAEKSGAKAANDYLASLRPSKPPRQPGKFRMGLLLELIEQGIAAEEAKQSSAKK